MYLLIYALSTIVFVAFYTHVPTRKLQSALRWTNHATLTRIMWSKHLIKNILKSLKIIEMINLYIYDISQNYLLGFNYS